MNYNGFKECFSEQGITVYLGDCMKLLEQTPDKYYDLCICDPPYGIGMAGYKTFPKSRNGSNWERKAWDNRVPDGEYFAHLARVSINMIAWGANHYSSMLKDSRGWVFWDKDTNGHYSDGELAYTSFDMPLRVFRFTWDGFRQGQRAKEQRIHPTQKPVSLYRWLLQNYAKPGQTILDTHLGSGSSAIAAWEMGFTFTGIEIDKEYFDAAVERIKKRMAQPYLPMEINEVVKAEQQPLFNYPHPTG